MLLVCVLFWLIIGHVLHVAVVWLDLYVVLGGRVCVCDWESGEGRGTGVVKKSNSAKFIWIK